MINLGILLADPLDPPELAAARTWYQKAADAGDTDAMINLGNLLATNWTRPSCPGPHLVEKAADAGHTGAMFNLSCSQTTYTHPDSRRPKHGGHGLPKDRACGGGSALGRRSK